MPRNPTKWAYTAQRIRSQNRNIPFKFSYEEWVLWWKNNLGPNWFSLRGRKRGQYVMARNGDRGSYEPDNVQCILAEDNKSHAGLNQRYRWGENHPKAKITAKQAKAIRKSKIATRYLAVKYGLSPNSIREIRSGRNWKHL